MRARRAEEYAAPFKFTQSRSGVVGMSQAIIEARDITKFFVQPGGGRIEVIAPTDLAIYPGTIVALLGPSGSGK